MCERRKRNPGKDSFEDDIEFGETKITTTFMEEYLEYENVRVKVENIPSYCEASTLSTVTPRDDMVTTDVYIKAETPPSDPGNLLLEETVDVDTILELVKSDGMKKKSGRRKRITNRTDDSSKPSRCEQCDECFSNTVKLRRHERKHMMGNCPICKKTMQIDNIKYHIGSMHPGDTTPGTGNRSFPCDHCNKSFYNQAHLIVHERVHQTEECSVCRETVRSSYMKEHMARKHPNKELEHRCDQCKKTFGTKILLSSHQRNHKKEQCTVCDRMIRNEGMQMHMATAHSEHVKLPAGKQYRCDACDRTFFLKKQLTKHRRKHRMEVCPICERSFGTYYMKIHTARKHARTADAAR